MISQIELSFVTENTLGSAAIRWFTHSNYSHVDIITPDGYRLGARSDHPVNLNAVNLNAPTDPIKLIRAGVQKRPMDYAPFTRDDRLIIECQGVGTARAYLWLYQQIGKPYDKRGLFASFLFDRPVPWYDERAWWCSELAAVFVAKATGKPCRTVASRVSPNDCYIYAGCFAQ